MSLRPYQIEARDAVYRSWGDQRSSLLVMATGTGKTYAAGEILRGRAAAGRVLWLAHRSELLDQARETLEERIGLPCELERAEDRATVLGSTLFSELPVVVASVQTLKGKRLRRWPAHAFATIVVDEAHHAAARGYREILAHFAGAKVLGLTATPDRGDGIGLGGVFDVVAYEYDIRRAIREGNLAPIVARSVECADLDLSDIKTVAGDLAQGELERAMRADAVLHQIAGPLVSESSGRPTIVFTAGVEQAHALVEVLAGYMDPRRVQAIDGTMPAELRKERIAAYRAGALTTLVNCMILTEGFDAPETSCIALARPTKSRALCTQMIGRGTRLFDGKSDCLVLDFVGNCGRHTLVTPLDVLAGREIPPDVRKRAADMAASMPAEEALAKAEQEALDRARRDEERRLREAKIRAEVAYRATNVDPFGITGITGVADDAGGVPASPAQITFLEKLGYVADRGAAHPTRTQASAMIESLKKRRAANLCTFKQARILGKNGLPTDLSFPDARAAIDAIVENGWRCPDWLRSKYAGGAEDAAE